MAMDSMVRLALCLSSCLMLCSACTLPDKQTQTSAMAIPEVWVVANDQAFTHNQGILLYNNHPFSGWQYLLYASGDTAKVIPFYAGKEEGWSKNWYPNKALAEQRFYRTGKKENEHKAWWEDGKPKFLYHFSNDEHEGIQQIWAANGTLVQTFHYVKGHEEGHQQAWFEDGTLKSNYVIKAGRRFGLPGVKNCESVIENNTFVKPKRKVQNAVL